MFRPDKLKGNNYILDGEDGKTILRKEDGTEEAIPAASYWVVGAAYLARIFRRTVQRIYQYRDIGILTPEEEKDQGEEVYNLSLALRDFSEFRLHGKQGIFSGGPLKKKKTAPGDDPFDLSEYDFDFDE